MTIVGPLMLILAGLATAYAGREVARAAEEENDTSRALIGLGLLIIGAVGVFLGISLSVTLSG